MERKTVYEIQVEYGAGDTLQEVLVRWLLQKGGLWDPDLLAENPQGAGGKDHAP